MGPSCRALLGANLTGIASLIKRVRADPRSSDYHLHGCARMTKGILDLCVVSAFSASVADTLMAEVLEDDRVVRRLEVLKDVVDTELRFLHTIPGAIFDHLASLTSCTAQELRDRVVTASTTTA
eukprot:12434904-Heterocapsa_arctica.AAC.1